MRAIDEIAIWLIDVCETIKVSCCVDEPSCFSPLGRQENREATIKAGLLYLRGTLAAEGLKRNFVMKKPVNTKRNGLVQPRIAQFHSMRVGKVMKLLTVAILFEITACTTGSGSNIVSPSMTGSTLTERRTISQNYQHSSSSSYQRHRRHHREKRKRKVDRSSQESTLSDVWFCLAFALGWSVWMLSTFLREDTDRFQSESVLVKGHVLEVSIEDDSLGTGIPTYHALIDYVISKVQVRKSFQTQHLLQQGFANVEVLVLPEEPTTSMLKEDWQRELEEEELASNDEESVSLDLWVNRASLVVASILVAFSFAGAVRAVNRMPNEREELKGWISLICGVVFLWPAATLILRSISTMQRLFVLPTHKSGIILNRGREPLSSARVGAEQIIEETVSGTLSKESKPKESADPELLKQPSSTEDRDSYFIRLPPHMRSQDNSSCSSISGTSGEDAKRND